MRESTAVGYCQSICSANQRFDWLALAWACSVPYIWARDYLFFLLEGKCTGNLHVDSWQKINQLMSSLSHGKKKEINKSNWIVNLSQTDRLCAIIANSQPPLWTHINRDPSFHSLVRAAKVSQQFSVVLYFIAIFAMVLSNYILTQNEYFKSQSFIDFIFI